MVFITSNEQFVSKFTRRFQTKKKRKRDLGVLCISIRVYIIIYIKLKYVSMNTL